MDVNMIKEIIKVAKRMDDKGMCNAFEGNVSAKKDGLLYITPSGQNKAYLTEEMIAVIDEDGNQVSGMYKPSSEVKMHAAMYGMRDNIGGVVHSHTPFLTAYAMCNKTFCPKSNAELLWDHKAIEVLSYGRPGSDDIYKGAQEILDKNVDIMLLGNHGVLAVGTTVEAAQNKMESAESSAKISFVAQMIGKECDLPEDEVEYLLNLFD